MAQQVRVDLVDDIDGSEAVESVSFMLDGVNYEIDLSEDNAAALRDELTPFIEVGRRTGGRKVRTTASRRTNEVATKPDRDRARTIRAWAHDNDWPISNRGRIPIEVITAYDNAQQKLATGTARSRSRRKK